MVSLCCPGVLEAGGTSAGGLCVKGSVGSAALLGHAAGREGESPQQTAPWNKRGSDVLGEEMLGALR